MKRLKSLLLGLFIFLTLNNHAQEFGKLFDERDQKTYKTIKLGEDTWMAENLRFWVEKDSPHYVGVSHFYRGNNQNYQLYGRLYPWEVAMKVCPEGWHLPSPDEWIALINSFGDIFNEEHRIPTKKQSSKAEVKRRKALYKDIYAALITGGSSGFNVGYGGFRDPHKFQGVSIRTASGYYSGLGTVARFWTNDDKIEKGMFKKLKAKAFQFSKMGKSFFYLPYRKSIGSSVRCVKNR